MEESGSGPPTEPHPVIERLRGLEPERLTPLEALNLVARWAEEVREDDGDQDVDEGDGA